MNLHKELLGEIERCKSVLEVYKEIPQGVFGTMMIKNTINDAKKAISDNDVVAMVKSLENLKDIE